MKFLIRFLVILLLIVFAMGLFDTVYNGLLKGDGYHPVTEQMKDVSGQ